MGLVRPRGAGRAGMDVVGVGGLECPVTEDAGNDARVLRGVLGDRRGDAVAEQVRRQPDAQPLTGDPRDLGAAAICRQRPAFLNDPQPVARGLSRQQYRPLPDQVPVERVRQLGRPGEIERHPVLDLCSRNMDPDLSVLLVQMFVKGQGDEVGDADRPVGQKGEGQSLPEPVRRRRAGQAVRLTHQRLPQLDEPHRVDHPRFFRARRLGLALQAVTQGIQTESDRLADT